MNQKKLPPSAPAIVIAALDDEAQVMMGDHSDPPNAFLGKPYQRKELRETISRVLSTNKNDGI
jgi:hypothetical protein